MNDRDKVEKSEKSRDEIPVDAWMVRSCFEYKTELNDCEKNFGVNYLKFKQKGQTLGYIVKKTPNGIEISEDPDQTAPLGLFAPTYGHYGRQEIHEDKQGRRYQNYVYGTNLDCTQWKKDYENCVKFSYNNDIQAGKDLIAVEEARRQHRIKCARANDIWKYRRHPPEDWNAPLGNQKVASQNETIQNEAAGQNEAVQSQSRTNETPLEVVTEKSKCAVS